MIRIHVVANSDSPQDQRVKLAVRDAVLSATEPILKNVDSTESAELKLTQNLDALEQAANEALNSNGTDLQANVTWERELFGTRYYYGFALPGGYYNALRITVGAGEGKNWWCVVYPQICMTSSSELQEAVAVMGGMEEDDFLVIQEQDEDYTLKFKTLELFENLLTWFRSGRKGIPTSG